MEVNFYEKMESLRSELDQLIEKKADYDKILKKSQELDKYIVESYKIKEKDSN